MYFEVVTIYGDVNDISNDELDVRRRFILLDTHKKRHTS
jgi:hypothetical protein